MQAKPPTIVFMENEKTFRHDYRDILLRGNLLNVKLAPNVGTAKNLIDNEKIDAAIFDIRMSKYGNEGLGLIQELRSKNPYAYIEVVTFFNQFKKASLDRGADKVIIKPLSPNGDVNRIRKGILKKRFERLANVTEKGIQQISEIFKFGIDDADWNDRIFELDIITENLEKIKYYLKEMRKSKLHQDISTGKLFIGIVDTLLDRHTISRHNIEASANTLMKEKTNQIRQQGIEDVNLGALDVNSDILPKSLGQYVAVVQGNIVDVDDDVEKLVKRVTKDFPDDNRLIHHVSKKYQEPLRIRGPRLKR